MIQMPISNWEMTSQIPKNTVDQTPNGPLVPLLLSTPAPQTVGSACQSPTQKPWSIPRKWKPNDRAPWGLKLGNIKGKICILYMYMYIESRKIHQRRPQIAKDILGEQPKAVSWQQHQHPGSKAVQATLLILQVRTPIALAIWEIGYIQFIVTCFLSFDPWT